MRKSMVKPFQVIDKNHNGYIDPTELKREFTKSGETMTDDDAWSTWNSLALLR